MAAVRGRPSREPQQPVQQEDPVDRFINGAGGADSPQGEEPKRVSEEKALKLRLPAELLADVDEAVKNRKPAPSRHQWILEAIYEKLEREKGQSEG